MKETESKKVITIILSVLAGLFGAAATFFILILFFFATGLFGWSDGGSQQYLDRLENTTKITLIISIIAALVIGVLIILKINKPKK